MILLRKIKELISRLSSTPELNKTFIFPYSTDKLTKRNEIWSNLQKGILLEDDKILIPWKTPFNQLNRYKEIRKDSGDRTEWYLRENKVLDGYKSHLSAMMWMYLPWTNPFERVSEFLGFGNEGQTNFKNLVAHLNDILGEPSKSDIKYENDSFTEGGYEWQNENVIIRVFGFDIHGARYMMNIGLITNSDEEFRKKSIEKLKTRGFTEEDLGK